ncbi:malto-oligosyltrehalose synthase [Pedobacter agri]|uniref:malto-oligosyltrehalose synthase n=1 Tax=Pedobacter agri TaxID=454586 RepID=UPI00292E672D|nr:malto-oligosyltrehalose synthase [Pedobacter agri]
MFKPTSTYRIQFHKDFNLKSLNKIIPYLKKLGIDTIYASPIFEALDGSTHGYDVVNPLRINPEIGTEAELIKISEKLKNAGISWLQDIVPNHMAFSPKNKWLMDVLKKGAKSKYATFFDIDISNNKKLMVPFLGNDLGDAIENSELKLIKNDGKYFLNIGDSNWPLNESSQRKISNKNKSAINNKQFVEEIANSQYYRLCNWQETNQTINYRRFFTVNALICLNIQHQYNFDTYHEYILSLIKKGIFQGLRIDHIDGLYDPKEYLDRLRKAAGEDIYIVVEKILERDEKMHADWEAQGSTGYDFLSMANNLLTNQANEAEFDEIYKDITGKNLDPNKLIYEKKEAFLFQYMQGELENLFQLYLDLNLSSNDEIELIGEEKLKLGLAEMLIQMPVYRYYNYNFPLSKIDEENLSALLKIVGNKDGFKDVSLFLKRVFIEEPKNANVEYNDKLRKFYQRLMQFSGPLMAKGVEDTVMFTYNRFIGHSEVGDAPDAFGLTLDQFHNRMIDRQMNWPLSLNGSSTHDTKKGEDFRARINVLTDLPDEWKEGVQNFITSIKESKKLNEIFKSVHNNDFYLIFQTILGAIPYPGEDADDLHNRLTQFIEKALREAKKRSDWAEPNEAYEKLVQGFALQLVNKTEESFTIINHLLNRIADFGIVNSLSQLVLKFACPGIPDVYQGTELWDLSLVDPDNRRPVDYEKRNQFIDEELSLKKLWAERYSGKIKLWLTRKLIDFRKKNSDVFATGEYIPLKVKGAYQSNILAFARKYKNEYIIIALPVALASISKPEEKENFNWLDTQIILPGKFPSSWRNMITEKDDVKDILNDGILVSQIFGELPIGIIELKIKKNDRSAGILMHITSLPSKYGIGDFGSEANRFVDFLKETNQQYWQLLPLNPTKTGNGHSPYSSNSAKAGNILLIDLEQLANEGLLSTNDLNASITPFEEKIDFQHVEKTKFKLLQKAYKAFKKNKPPIISEEFLDFCKKEGEWLDDFALYTAIKHHHKQLEWYNWPTAFKTRELESIESFSNKYADEINEVKWQQYLFSKQWHLLKDYANSKGIKMIGDLPFYLDYDSVEVWSKPGLFKLDADLKPTFVAGVPPDYFNENGQLWGMPIFNWSAMKRNNYEWWIKRLQKNMEMFDLLRLDHFIAFSSYWEIPADSESAINGKWIKGEGNNFFKVIKRNFPEMPFIAEDLGEISTEVELLRDQFQLPGMKVLQFSFGSDISASSHIPHNYENQNCIVYSGTHDNNTLIGWYNNEIEISTKERINKYFGQKIDENNIHQELIRLAFSSTAKIAILPIQDILGLDEKSRMNIPGKAHGNWLWRLDAAKLKPIQNWLADITSTYGRSK